MLPRVKIFFDNGALGLVTPSPDGVLGIVVCGCTVVGTTFLLSTPYILTSMAKLTALGVTAVNNPALYKVVSEFYAEAGEGTEVWIIGQPDTIPMTDALDIETGVVRQLIDAANGRLRGIVITRKPAAGYLSEQYKGLDVDVFDAISAGQQLAVWSTNVKFAPIFVLIAGLYYSGNPVNLEDLTLGTNNRVGVLIGDTVANSNGAAVGLLAGRIAAIPVQRNIGRVKSGPVASLTAFIKEKAVEKADNSSIHDKGYITFRTFIGRAGYFFSDDVFATAATDDYSHLTARRTIDKAFRIAYNSLLEMLLDEIPVTATGSLQTPIVKSWQAQVENDIANSMTASGELSADVNDPNDKGVICYINPTQNIISTSRLEVKIRVRPFGYGRYIDIYLGFATATA